MQKKIKFNKKQSNNQKNIKIFTKKEYIPEQKTIKYGNVRKKRTVTGYYGHCPLQKIAVRVWISVEKWLIRPVSFV